MSCPHSTRSDVTPASCSQCIGVAVARTAIAGPLPIRELPAHEYYKRGGRRGGPARARSISQAFDTSDTKKEDDHG